MDYEQISSDLLIELENASIPELTAEEERYIEMTIEFKKTNEQLTEIIKILCELVSKLSNIQYKLNLLDDSVVLK